jgi:hypothetical protein
MPAFNKTVYVMVGYNKIEIFEVCVYPEFIKIEISEDFYMDI